MQVTHKTHKPETTQNKKNTNF